MNPICPCGRINQKEGLTITGKVKVRSHPAGRIAQIKALHASGRHDDANALLRSGKLEAEQHNIIVDSSNYGIDILIQYLISAYNGSNPFPLGIAWGEIGTGNTTPTVGDIALTAPTNRAPVAYASDQAFQTAQLQFFFPNAVLANGTYYEFGSFIGGSGSIGSGNMFNHALFQNPYSKSSGTDSTIECDFSLANS